MATTHNHRFHRTTVGIRLNSSLSKSIRSIYSYKRLTKTTVFVSLNRFFQTSLSIYWCTCIDVYNTCIFVWFNWFICSCFCLSYSPPFHLLAFLPFHHHFLVLRKNIKRQQQPHKRAIRHYDSMPRRTRVVVLKFSLRKIGNNECCFSRVGFNW